MLMKYSILTIALFLSSLLSGFDINQHESPQKLLSKMTLREKIGQLCMVAAVSNEERNQDLIQRWARWQPLYHLEKSYIDELIKTHAIGGIIFFGRNTYPEEQIVLTKHFQSLSNTPLLIGLDAECGLASQLNNEAVLRFPFNMTLGAVRKPELIYKTAYETGRELKSLGVHINFAPVVDVNNNPKNPVIGMRSFGSDKELVATLGIAQMQGFQDAGIIACAKHFPGHGDTSTDSHEALPIISHSKEHLEELELYPFQKLINAGVESVMIAHLDVPALEKAANTPSTISYAIVTELLKKKMGFNGLIFTDALGMKAIADCYEPGEVEVKALQAGADILLCPLDPVKAIDSIEQAVHSGTLNETDINKKVLKILKAKARAFLHTREQSSINFKSKHALELKKKLYTQAITTVQSTDEAEKRDLTDIEMYQSPDLKPFEEKLQSLSMQKSPESLKHVVIALTHTFPFDDEIIVDTLKDHIQDLKNESAIVTVVLFCTPYHIPLVQGADRIVVAYENDPDAQIAAAEVLCGKRKATGVLPITFN